MTTVNGNNGVSSWIKDYAAQLDARDGKQDGKIQASVWNEYAQEVGAKQIKNFMLVEDAYANIDKYGCELPEEEIETSEEVNQAQPVVVGPKPAIQISSCVDPVIKPDTITTQLDESKKGDLLDMFLRNLKYPDMAQAMGLEGKVSLEITTDPKDPRYAQYRILRSPHESLSKATLDAAKQTLVPSYHMERVVTNNGKTREASFRELRNNFNVFVQGKDTLNLNFKLN